jgi:hypothetical protein
LAPGKEYPQKMQCIKIYNQEMHAGIIFYDLAKAIDCVNHEI